MKRPSNWPLRLTKRFVEFLHVLILSQLSSRNDGCEDLALRLPLNLNNNDCKACDVLGLPSVAQTLVQSVNHRFSLLTEELEYGEHELTLNRAVPALGIMFNLVGFSDEARFAVIA